MAMIKMLIPNGYEELSASKSQYICNGKDGLNGDVGISGKDGSDGKDGHLMPSIWMEWVSIEHD